MVRCLLCPFPWPLQGFKSFRNCYLAGFQHPLKPSKASKPFLLGFETALWHFRSATSCFYWASKLLSGTFSAPPTFPWPFQSFKSFSSCYLAGFQHPLKFSKASKPFLLGFETALWHFRSATTCFYWASKLLSGTFSAPPTVPWPFQCWASKLLSGTSEAPQAVAIGLRNCYLARFQHPLKPSKPSKPSQQLSTAFRCLLCPFPWPGFESDLWHFPFHGPFKASKASEAAIWQVFSTP